MKADLPYLLKVLKPFCFLVVALKRAVHWRPPLTATVTSELADLPYLFKVLKPFSFWWWLWKGLFTENCHCHQWTSRSPLSAESSETLFPSGGGSGKGCSLKTAAAKSEQADLVYLLRVIYILVALKRAATSLSLTLLACGIKKTWGTKLQKICCHMLCTF